MIFTCIFKANKKEKRIMIIQYVIYSGFTIYTQSINNNKKVPCCECIRLLCKSYKNCINMFVNSENKPGKDCEICCCKYDSADYEKKKRILLLLL